jgi:ABC-type multidrug transport system fused ATPase/permease subunit
MEKANNGINLAIFQIFNLVRVLAALLRIAFLLIILFLHDKGTLSTADVAGMFALLIVFESFLFDSTEFYKNFTKDFTDIEKLWDMFDNAPKLKGYHTGSSFSPKNKPIIIKDITYGYNENKVFHNFSLTIEK